MKKFNELVESVLTEKIKTYGSYDKPKDKKYYTNAIVSNLTDTEFDVKTLTGVKGHLTIADVDKAYGVDEGTTLKDYLEEGQEIAVFVDGKTVKMKEAGPQKGKDYDSTLGAGYDDE